MDNEDRIKYYEQIRLDCLTLANHSTPHGSSEQKVIERASAYEKFIRGE